MTEPKNIIGLRGGRLTVVSFYQKKNNKYYWLCVCDCGKTHVARSDAIKDGNVKSCGCLNVENLKSQDNIKKLGQISRKHGFTAGIKSQFYRAWDSMINRCLESNKTHKKRYYDRGITVDKKWSTFQQFHNDMYIDYVLHFKKHGKSNTTLDRKDNDKGYSINNCRWATKKEQSNNRSISKKIC